MFNPRVIKIILIIALIGLISYIWIDSNSLSCNQCKVTFSNNKISGVSFLEPQKKIVAMQDLYESFKQNESCLVSWSRTHGYR